MELEREALAVLSAMITPAVLISACGTLIFSTAARLARIVDRVRGLSAPGSCRGNRRHVSADQ